MPAIKVSTQSELDAALATEGIKNGDDYIQCVGNGRFVFHDYDGLVVAVGSDAPTMAAGGSSSPTMVALELAVRRRLSGQMAMSMEVSEWQEQMLDAVTYEFRTKVWAHEYETDDQIIPWSGRRTVGPSSHHKRAAIVAGLVLATLAAAWPEPLFVFSCVAVAVMAALSFKTRVEISGNCIVRGHKFNCFPDWEEVYPKEMGQVQQMVTVDPPLMRYSPDPTDPKGANND